MSVNYGTELYRYRPVTVYSFCVSGMKEQCAEICTDRELGTFGWTTCAAEARRHPLRIVFTKIGVTTTVAIVKTCRSGVERHPYNTVTRRCMPHRHTVSFCQLSQHSRSSRQELKRVTIQSHLYRTTLKICSRILFNMQSNYWVNLLSRASPKWCYRKPDIEVKNSHNFVLGSAPRHCMSI